MIEIVDYDPRWPGLFTAEAARLRAALGGAALRIEHVGSTAVPGLAAKPVIDLQISVATLEPHGRYVEIMAALSYHHADLGDFDRVYPFFHRPRDWPSTHHVHLCVAEGEQERKHLAFRDHLRTDAASAAEYAALKRELARRHSGRTPESRENYSLAKADFVARVLRSAGRANGSLRSGP